MQVHTYKFICDRSSIDAYENALPVGMEFLSRNTPSIIAGTHSQEGNKLASASDIIDRSTKGERVEKPQRAHYFAYQLLSKAKNTITQ